jgi:hypothetical protein
VRRFLHLLLAGLLAVGGCTGLSGPQLTSQIRQSCFWVDDTYLTNSLAMLVMDRDAGFTAQQELNGFTSSCVNSCVANGGDNANCTYNCTNCGMALVAEVWP